MKKKQNLIKIAVLENKMLPKNKRIMTNPKNIKNKLIQYKLRMKKFKINRDKILQKQNLYYRRIVLTQNL